MVHAFITFDTTNADGFAKAASQGASSLEGAKGYHGMRLLWGVEDPERFLLMVDWDSVGDHMAWMGVNHDIHGHADAFPCGRTGNQTLRLMARRAGALACAAPRR